MKRVLPLLLAVSLSTGCASSTLIRSNPSGANVRNQYGRVLCTTPCEYEDSEAGQHLQVFEIEKEGVGKQPLVIRKDNVNWGRAIGFGVGGLFLFPVWIGEAWIFDYDPIYDVQLDPGAAPAGNTSHVAASAD